MTAAAIVVLASTLLADAAQIGTLWSFGDLTEKADLIVIAERVATDEGRRAEHPALKPELPVVEMTTRFTILSILKGDASSPHLKEVRLLHYRLDWDEWKRRHPPQPGQPPPELVNAGSELQFADDASSYLLFLRRGRGGHYEPLSGHTFPTDSVYRLRKLERRQAQAP